MRGRRARGRGGGREGEEEEGRERRRRKRGGGREGEEEEEETDSERERGWKGERRGEIEEGLKLPQRIKTVKQAAIIPLIGIDAINCLRVI